MKEKKKCYLYTRVSTEMQVDGYSLDAQKDKLTKYAEFQDMQIVGEYSDEGKSGKNTEGRPQFTQMLKDIENGKDDVNYVLVFKLSRFGRNAADVLSSLQLMEDFNVHLIAVEDGIDSSKDSGKLMITVLSAVAEIERDNILVQTMEGRKQKAREGKWNGGAAPYGYRLVDGKLIVDEEEAKIVRLIYDKFINTSMSANGIAQYLNEQGYKKTIRDNFRIEQFASHFIVRILDSPIYCGDLSYGKTVTEKIPGKRNQYHRIKAQTYNIHKGIQEAIISKEDWLKAQQKRKLHNTRNAKQYGLNHASILSGIVKCPICGAGMYGNVNRKHKKDGSVSDYWYYACKHSRFIDGKPCSYHKQWGQDKVNAAVEEAIFQMVNLPQFEEAIKEKLTLVSSTEELDAELENLKNHLRQLEMSKDKLQETIDQLDPMDLYYAKKYEDKEKRLDHFYEQITETENKVNEMVAKINNFKENRVNADNVYKFLLYFDKLYYKLTDEEKKKFMNSFVESVELYETVQPNGKFLKEINFKFPIVYNGEEVDTISWEDSTALETVVFMLKAK